MQAGISVVIPTFNRCNSVCWAIESVQQQTLAADEIIVVDDGSDDGTAQKIREQFPDVQLIVQENHGVSHARNQGVQLASAPWIAFLDSDDRWFKNKLTVQMNALSESPEHKLCHCDEHWIRNGKRVNPMNKHQKRGGYIFEHCLPLCAISPSAVIVHQSLLEEIGLFDESLPACEDYDLWLRICASHPVLFVEQALLEKTGGHADQLSAKHWGMDRFRLHALAKLLRQATLSTRQSKQAHTVFMQKFGILLNGAEKRGNHEFAQELKARYEDLL